MTKYLNFLMLMALFLQLGCRPEGSEGEESESQAIQAADTLNNLHVRKKPQSTQIMSRLPKGRQEWFYYTDEYDDTHGPFETGAEENALHEIYLSFPVLLFSADRDQTPYLIYPGETVMITENQQKDLQLKIEGDSARNNELHFFRALKSNAPYSFNLVSILKNSRSMLVNSDKSPDFEKITRDARKRYKEQITFLYHYQQKYNISQHFLWYCKKYFYYSMILNQLIPFIPEKYKSFTYPENYLKTLSTYSADFKCDSCLNILPYRMAACFYLKFLARNELSSDSAFITKWEQAKNYFSGKTKNYLIFHMTKDLIRQNPTMYDSIKNKFYLNCTDKGYRSYILNSYGSYLSIQKSNEIKNTPFINCKGEALTWDSIMKDNLGKVIYIDFWASWCVPCRKEIPYSISLRQKYLNKDVVFIYVSIDQKKSSWMNAIKELHMPEKDNFLLLNLRSSEFMKYVKIASIPKYIIVNKSGEIINLDAPGPHESNIDKELLKLLNK